MKPLNFKHRMFGYDRNLLPNAHLADLERDVANIEQAREKSGFTIGYPGWGLIYYALLSHLDREREEILVETGTNWGCTTIVLAQALVDAGCRGKVISIDIDEANIARARANIEAADLADRVELLCGDSRNLLKGVAKKHGPFRFAFIDASHLYDDVLFEFDTLLPHFSDDALVLFDNTFCIADPDDDQRVNGALKTIRKREGGNLINFEFVSWGTPGLAIWQRKPNL